MRYSRTTTPLRLIIGLTVTAVLLGCVNQQEARKQLRESEGYYKEGVSFLQTDQQRAFVSFQKAVQLDPNNFDAHYALGSIYFQRKEFRDAEREFRASTELNPHSGEALNFLGRTLILQDRKPEAIEVIRKATKLPLYATPDIAYTDLGWLLASEGDITGAIEAYEYALKTDPPNIPRSFIYLWLGRLYMKQGDVVQAKAALSQAKTLDPDGAVGKDATRLLQGLK